MGTRSDFYLGRGKDAKWLCSIAYDGHPESIDDAVMDATNEQAFLEALRAFTKGRDDVSTPEDGWPWPWNNSHTSDYAYAFDDGLVWIAGCWGHDWYPDRSWWLSVPDARAYDHAVEEWQERDDPDELEPPELCSDIEAVFPDMSDIKNVNLTFGPRLYVSK